MLEDLIKNNRLPTVNVEVDIPTRSIVNLAIGIVAALLIAVFVQAAITTPKK